MKMSMKSIETSIGIYQKMVREVSIDYQNDFFTN